jgi:alkanesulfonate monooxygenase SsuD/methylene tetrahydromethanopterin reductase-like flavin-dependent oxidoreductase (luciferase family)
VVEFCDGWFPRARGDFDAKVAVARLKRVATDAGRDPAGLPITVFNAPADQRTLAAYREAGIHRALLHVLDLPRDEALRELDKLAPLASH